MKLPHDSLVGTLSAGMVLTIVLYLIIKAWIQAGLS
jgi:hypothetical protein